MEIMEVLFHSVMLTRQVPETFVYTVHHVSIVPV